MKALALAMMVAVPCYAQDAGVDAGSDAPLRGVYRIVSAEQGDGGTLGPGWYLTSDKMLSVGKHVVVLENENEQMKTTLLNGPQPSMGFWIGMIVGATVGIGGTVMVVRALK